jgi:preprotein translocase subunit YajC
MFFANLVLLAQQTNGTEPSAPFWSSIALMAPIFILGYLLLLRPQQRQERERRERVAKLKKNDKVVNSGGIIGEIADIKDGDEVVLKGGLRITKSSIVQILSEEPEKK